MKMLYYGLCFLGASLVTAIVSSILPGMFVGLSTWFALTSASLGIMAFCLMIYGLLKVNNVDINNL